MNILSPEVKLQSLGPEGLYVKKTTDIDICLIEASSWVLCPEEGTSYVTPLTVAVSPGVWAAGAEASRPISCWGVNSP